jgi:hypothetical protein
MIQAVVMADAVVKTSSSVVAKEKRGSVSAPLLN